MPINKQFLKSRPEVKVTFAVEKEAAGEAEQVLLLGEFSQWQPIELKRMKSGEFKATLNLPTDGPSHFEYCYQLVQPDGETRYDNDWEADDYVPGPSARQLCGAGQSVDDDQNTNTSDRYPNYRHKKGSPLASLFTTCRAFRRHTDTNSNRIS